MTILKISNPFNAPVYHEETVTSTMDVSCQLASNDEPHGTVITADFQSSGRGRVQDRNWLMEEKSGLPFSILFRYPRIEEIPPALTLRIGLAVCFAIEDFAPSLKGKVMVKWPNDIMINSKKVSGILCEASGGTVHAGIGINFSQKEFPIFLREKATSVALAGKIDLSSAERFSLLEKILALLFDELEKTKRDDKNWKSHLEQRLYKKDENVVFIEGAAGSGREVKGRLAGIGKSGELLITPNGEIQPRSFVTGELTFL